MEKVEPKPLDLDGLEKELKRKWEEHLEKEGGSCHCLASEESCIPEKIEFLKEIKQRIKSACEFYLKYFYNPFELWNDYPELRNDKLREWIRDITENEGTAIEDCAMFRYNEWLFRLAFKDIFEEVKP